MEEKCCLFFFELNPALRKGRELWIDNDDHGDGINNVPLIMSSLGKSVKE